MEVWGAVTENEDGSGDGVPNRPYFVFGSSVSELGENSLLQNAILFQREKS